MLALLNSDKVWVMIFPRYQKDAITPKWALNYKESLDKFYTKPDIAKYCHGVLLDVARQHKFDLTNHVWIEPSAGDGVFYRMLPEDRRIGLDLKPESPDITAMDFFDFTPDKSKKYVALGNPPFGLRGWLALAFLNRLAEFTDLVGFILPMYFASDGKGSCKSRVKGLTLLHSEELPADIFTDNGKPVKINCVFQVWGKAKVAPKPVKACNDYVDIYTVCTYHSRKCGLDRMNEYAFFISSTFFANKGTALCKTFDEVQYGSGYGIIVKKKKKEIEEYLRNVDWTKYSTRATNHCRHLGMVQIRKALTDGGFVDK